MGLAVELNWPETCLWPNRRQHWRKVAQAKRQAKAEAVALTKQAMCGYDADTFVPSEGDIVIRIVGERPAEHGQDRDNFQAALKASLDGVALALGVNDKRFRPVTDWGEDCPPHGRVLVSL